MKIALITINLRSQWVHSLKEKRMIVSGLCQKLRNKFNVSVIESDNQDSHQSIVISIAFLAADNPQKDSVKEKILNFVESATEAEIIDVFFEDR